MTSAVYTKRKHYDDLIKHYHMTKVSRNLKRSQKAQPMGTRIPAPKAPRHTVMGHAYHKSKNGVKKFCGS